MLLQNGTFSTKGIAFPERQAVVESGVAHPYEVATKRLLLTGPPN